MDAPGGRKITLNRIYPASIPCKAASHREGIETTFSFSSREAMWAALRQYHKEEDIFIALTVYGSVDFKTSL